MRIGEVAEQAGVRPSTIRFYERRGLLPAPARTAAGYRDYGPEIVARLRFIQGAQRVGLTLAELGSVIALREQGTAPCTHALALLEDREREIAGQVEQLRVMQTELRQLVERGTRLDPAECTADAVCHVVTGDPTASTRGG